MAGQYYYVSIKGPDGSPLYAELHEPSELVAAISSFPAEFQDNAAMQLVEVFAGLANGQLSWGMYAGAADILHFCGDALKTLAEYRGQR